MRGLRFIHISLPIQLVGMAVSLVIFSVSAIGIPAILLLRGQLDRQARLLIEQGSQTTQALYSAQKSHLQNLAILTAQRPTLVELMRQGEADKISAYLQTLKTGAGLDAILLCDPQGQTIAQSGLSLPAGACSAQHDPYGIYEPVGPDSPIWLLAAHPVEDLPSGYAVIVGQALDSAFLERLHAQTGLEYILLTGEDQSASSFSEGQAAWEAIAPQLSKDQGDSAIRMVALQEVPFYTLRSRLDGANLALLIFLSASHIELIQSQLTWMIGGSILAVVLVGMLLVVPFARRIGVPLESLRRSASALRRGDLTTPVAVRTRVLEISQVAYALEDARITLQHSLDSLRKEKEWAEHLLDSIVEGIVVLDRHNRITFFSPGAERISGWTQERVLYKHIDEVFQLSDGSGGLSGVLPVTGGKQSILTVLGNHRRLTLAMTSARLVPPDTGKTGTALVLRDISNEEAIHRLLGNFLANITHEFRTPLSALAASTELLLEQLPSLSQAELKELLNSLRLGILSLQILIDNLLEGASIEAGRFRVFPRQTDLSAVVQEVVHTVRPLLEKYGQRLSMHIPDQLPSIWADPRRTGQVLVNLFSNAIKMGPAGSEVTLSVAVEEQAVKVCVGDRGPGIPAEMRQDIFSRFAHESLSDNRAEHGAGLGLSVVKAIVEAQEGQVGVSDGPQGGAVFWFTIPIARETPVQEGQR